MIQPIRVYGSTTRKAKVSDKHTSQRDFHANVNEDEERQQVERPQAEYLRVLAIRRALFIAVRFPLDKLKATSMSELVYRVSEAGTDCLGL